jgi:hypothetical protein
MRVTSTPTMVGAGGIGIRQDERMRQVSDPRGADAAWMIDATPADRASQAPSLARLMHW